MNSRRSLTIVVAGMICCLATEASCGSACARELFDFDWRFLQGDPPGAENPEFDDTGWQPVDLPHDFAIYGPFDRNVKNGVWNGFRPLGIGWYRKSFVTPQGIETRSVRLDFEGVYRCAKVWVNGTLVAENASCYRGFDCEITRWLKPAGQPNIVAVRADNSLPLSVTWYSGGGIFRHVWLVVTGDVRVARHGTFVTTPKISTDEATVNVRTEIENVSLEDKVVTLTSDALDTGGKVLATARAAVPVPHGEIRVFHQELTVPKPVLWDLEHPTMYRLSSRVHVAGKETDRYETPFGFREIRLTPNGLLLNGKRQFVKGLNIHHDLGCLGVAAFDRAIERRLAVIKEIGCNALRLSHNPHAPALLDLCDRMGILVFNEAFCNWGDLKKGEFARTWQRDLEEFLRRDRNHPSVFIWSVGNQVSAAERGPDFGCTQYDAMAAVVHRLDPTRPATCALRPIRRDGKGGKTAQFSPDNDAEIHQMAQHMDVMSANYMEKWFAKDRLKYPDLVFITSECTTGDDGRGPWFDLDREHAVGLFYWGGINYIGESRGWPVKCWNGGFVDWAGYRRPSSWVLQSLLSDEPMVHLAVKTPERSYVNWDGVRIFLSGLRAHWNFPAGSKVEVEAVTNADEVELLLNGRTLGVKKREGSGRSASRLFWNVTWKPGTIAAVARRNGRHVAHDELRTAGPPKRLRLTPDRLHLRADGQDLSHVTVEVVDPEGVVVPDAGNVIKFEVAGCGTNAGVQNSDVLSDELFQADHRSAYEGRALLVVRAKRKVGDVLVKATADGLETASVLLSVRP